MESHEYIKKLESCQQAVTEAEETFLKAKQLYQESRINKSQSIDKKIAELRTELDDTEKNKKALGLHMSDALGAGELETAIQIEKQIVKANSKVEEILHKIELLSTVDPKGDSDFYLTVVKAFRNYSQLVFKTSEILEALQKSLREDQMNLAKISESLRVDKDLNSIKLIQIHRGNTGPIADLIAIVENAEGIIDVRGHAAGTDQDAKARYVNGNISGLENTEAGKKLADSLGVELPKTASVKLEGRNLEYR